MDEFSSPPAPVHAGVASTAAAGTHARTALLARIGLLGIGAAALIAVAALAFGSSAAPTGTIAAGTLAAGTSPDGSGGALNLHGFGGSPGGRGGFGHGMGGITITAISGSKLSLETADGWTRTITVDAGTTYSRSGDTIALGDLAVGDEIAFRQTREDDGSWTIDAIAVILPHVAGEVTAVSGSTITLQRRDGTSVTITVNAETEYQVNGDNAELADIEVGMFLVARGTENADGSLTATDVRAGERGMGGRGGFHGGPRPNGLWDDKPDAIEAPGATDSGN